MFLVIVDAFSKWLEVYTIPNCTVTETINKLVSLFIYFGAPGNLVTIHFGLIQAPP